MAGWLGLVPRAPSMAETAEGGALPPRGTWLKVGGKERSRKEAEKAGLGGGS